ncbi:MAG: exodeoxyribonuclease VII large subunit, partial [Planctomycetota bacterium]
MAKREVKTFSVSEVNSLVRSALAERLPSWMVVSGEISGWKHHSSGHCYFSLKDAGSQLPCVMWAGSFKRVKFAPENGMAVLAKGHIEAYVPGGKYQFYADNLEPAGVGALQLAFEQMVKRLRADGLFADGHKKPIPPYPMRIGIVTSESGAALVDIADSIYNRWPCARMFLYPAPVQGAGAADKIAAAIRNINRRHRQLRLDVLIVGRGGGSLEDLRAFNEEVLARAIFDSVIPVISAVGHEIDTTLAELVADARASTPTKAGVAAVPDMREIMGQLANVKS